MLDGSENFQNLFIHNLVTIVAGKRYCVTINVTQYFYQVLPFSRFPMQGENVVLLGSVYEEAHSTRFPQFQIEDVYYGLIDVDLQWVTQ